MPGPRFGETMSVYAGGFGVVGKVVVTRTPAPGTKHPSLRIAVLIGVYLLFGLLGLGIVSIAAWFADPCGPECASVSGSGYADLQEAVLGLGGLVYLVASVPLAILRARRIVWLVPLLACALVTIGGVAILATGAEGGLCDCGFGAGTRDTVRSAVCSCAKLRGRLAASAYPP
jgi:hypothetical protein